jgi:Zn ribbon nucleic-acid-binding protein
MAVAAKKKFSAPAECPVCGADVPPQARACPECGADERTGWNEDDTRYDGLDLPDSAFEDDDKPRKSRRSASFTPRVNGIAIHWWLLAVLVLVVLIAGALGVRL